MMVCASVNAKVTNVRRLTHRWVTSLRTSRSEGKEETNSGNCLRVSAFRATGRARVNGRTPDTERPDVSPGLSACWRELDVIRVTGSCRTAESVTVRRAESWRRFRYPLLRWMNLRSIHPGYRM